MKKIEFWFSLGSTYTFLSVSRIKNIIAENKIYFSLHPFSVRTVMKNMDNIPFPPSKKAKVNYMWRDIQRRSELYNLKVPNVPVPYPIKDLDLANQVALVGVKNGWCLDYLELTYKYWFYDHIEAGSKENLNKSLSELNLDLSEILKIANSEVIVREYEELTSNAIKIGVFGSPTFILGNELFWGDDRLEDVIKWLQK